jgi:PEP-CTERM motif
MRAGTVSVRYFEGTSLIELFSGTTRIFEGGWGTFSHSGVFEPGQYRLVANLDIGGFGTTQNAMYQFLFTPEPHSALLLGLGLALLARRRRA